MSSLPFRPLGQPIPDAPHAVSVSLPTMRDVRGYEEKDEEITRHLQLGYPRFVVHPFSRALVAHLLVTRPEFAGQKLWLTTSRAMAQALARHLGHGAQAFEDQAAHGVIHADSPEVNQQAKLYLQHIGGFVASREAEDQLIKRGLRHPHQHETLFEGDAAAEVRRVLLPALPGATTDDVFLTPSGMNSVYAAFRAINEVQAPRGRCEWIQIGWLYLDSIAILKKFTPQGGYHYLGDVFDLDALEALLQERGDRIAGLVTEIPTNPLVQTPDVARLAEVCRRHGVAVVLDPSVESVFSVDILRYTDLLVASLTKYTGNEGDVIAGLVAVNPAGKDAAALRKALPSSIEPIYPRDVARLAAMIGKTPQMLEQIHAATPKVAQFLAKHPKVKEVFWALEPRSAENYRRIARDGSGRTVGGMISFSLEGELAPFYDRLRLAKGPSFGMTTTLICPFMYLAHYDLVTTEEGRNELAASGLSPDLLRLCIGTEPVDEIIGALDEALRA